MTSLVQCKASAFTLEQLRILAVREGLFRNRPPRVSARHDAYMTNPLPGMYQPQQPVYAQQLIPGWEQRTQGNSGGAGTGGGGIGGGGGDGGDGPFSRAFDFSFSNYASPALIRGFYIAFVVLLAVGYALGVIAAFVLNPILGFMALIFGLIPTLALVLALRMGLEVTLATIRTAIDVRALRTRYVGPATE